eukprot:1090510-Lingulodinium_polyedra.AAC.1
MMLAFCCSLATTLERAQADARAAGGAAAVAAAELRYVGYQDDQYFRSTVAGFEALGPHLLTALGRDGHELQPAKSA